MSQLSAVLVETYFIPWTVSLTLDEPVGSLSLAQDVRSIRGPLAMQICSTVYLLLLYSALEILCAEVSAG